MDGHPIYPPPGSAAGERQRLDVLHALEILDTPPEQRFDRLTRLACRLFDVPIAAVSLVDRDRQFFKSIQGLDLTHSDLSFCGHAIHDRATMVVEDATGDPRFAGSPLVLAGPAIRFYAGRPLVLHDQAIGTLCVLDSRPRHLTDDDLAILGDLAALVERELAQTELVDAYGRLEMSQAIHRSVFEHCADALLLTNDVGQTVDANPAYEALMGQTVEELRQLGPWEMVDREDPRLAPIVEQRRAHGKAHGRLTLVRKGGERFEAEVATRMLKAAGQAPRVVSVIRDVTQALRVEKLKEEFLGIVSHDLRNPLGALRLGLEFLAEDCADDLPEDAKGVLGHATRAVDRMERLTRQLLDGERLVSGKVSLELAPVGVPALFDEVAGAMRGAAQAAGIALAVDADPVAVEADADKLMQVLANLVGNALKFSPRGSMITLRATAHDGRVALAVEDQGRGIPADKLALIFERFGQVEVADREVHGGTGLGLAIARGIVRAHGGELWVKSEVGQGSTFGFELAAT